MQLSDKPLVPELMMVKLREQKEIEKESKLLELDIKKFIMKIQALESTPPSAKNINNIKELEWEK